jgi:hypothetical protein
MDGHLASGSSARQERKAMRHSDGGEAANSLVSASIRAICRFFALGFA